VRALQVFRRSLRGFPAARTDILYVNLGNRPDPA
jgi:hypothetical protein